MFAYAFLKFSCFLEIDVGGGTLDFDRLCSGSVAVCVVPCMLCIGINGLVELVKNHCMTAMTPPPSGGFLVALLGSRSTLDSLELGVMCTCYCRFNMC
jgi:hypothetical protein